MEHGKLYSHIERTAQVKRENVLAEARIVSISNETPTIKRFVLRVDQEFHFLPGQWLDCHLPDVAVVGGYSICSTPKQLQLSRTLELAVKRSDHPPALWMHEQAQEGQIIHIRAGGEFVLRDEHLKSQLLFISG